MRCFRFRNVYGLFILHLLSIIYYSTEAQHRDIVNRAESLLGRRIKRRLVKKILQSEDHWHGVNKKTGLNIWSVKNFTVDKWPEQEYGLFYSGDSYIVVNSYFENTIQQNAIHIWIGEDALPAVYATAAYKAIELEAFLKGNSNYFKEEQFHESAIFKSYFGNELTYIDGATGSGYHKVKKSKPKLYRITKYSTEEVPLVQMDIDSHYVYVLDTQDKIVEWRGANSLPEDKVAAANFVFNRKGLRPVRILDDPQRINREYSNVPFYK